MGYREKRRPRCQDRPLNVNYNSLLDEVVGDQLGHLEHADRLLATEYGFQGIIGIDVGADLLVLQVVLLDINPQFLGEFCAG